MQQASVDEYPVVSERTLLERVYYHHGLFCANHPALVIFVCGVLIFLCSAPIVTFSLTAKIPSEWNETISVNGSNSEKPHWLKDKLPAAYIQQIVVAVLIEPVNNSVLLPYSVHEAFLPAFNILRDINEHKHAERKGERLKLSDLCFLISHDHDSFLLGKEEKILPKKGCLQISPANLWQHDVTSFKRDMNFMSKLYGKSSKNIVSLKENVFGVPLSAIGLFPLTAKNECLVIRYAVTTVLQKFNPSFTKSLKSVLLEKLPPVFKTESSNDAQTIVHIHYEGDNIIEIYHLCFTYFMVFIYLVFSVSKIEMVKSKLGLAFSAVVTVVASLSMAAGLCIFFGMVPSVSSSEIFPYLVIIIGLENILVLTRSIVSTHPGHPVPKRVAEGLSREGASITLNLATELLLLLCGYLTFVPAVQEFCMVGGVGVLTDFFLQIVFFATVLSIDLRRLEAKYHIEKRKRWIQACHRGDGFVCTKYSYICSLHFVGENGPTSDYPDPISAVKSAEQLSEDETLVIPVRPIESSDEQPLVNNEPQESNNWSDVLPYLYKPWKIFSVHQNLPKRLNFAYFWARTRIVQKGIMLFAIMYIIYITSMTFMNKDDFSTIKNPNDSPESLLTSNRPASEETFSPKNPFDTKNVAASNPSSHVTQELLNKKSHFACEDELKSAGLWRNLSRRHWPELLDLYGVNVMDRYISVLPPINLQYKVKNLQDLQGPAFHYSEKFYQEFSKDLRRTSQSYAVELAGFVKILYLITGIFIIVTVYLIYQLLSNPKKRKPIPNVIFLDGHQQSIECFDCNDNVIASSCIMGTVRVWDSTSTECISVVERKSRPSQIWSLHCWEHFVAMGCSNGDLEIWDFSEKQMRVLFECDRPDHGITDIRHISLSKILVICRLNGDLEFIDLGNRLSHYVDTNNVPLPSMRKKPRSNPSSWETIKNSVSNEHFPWRCCPAHRKVISVLAVCKGLVISGSHDSLLKVFCSQSGGCRFTWRGHITSVTALTTEPDATGVISGSADGEIRFWSIATGEGDRFSSKHSALVVAIVCTDSRIASLDDTEVFCIWDRLTKRCLQCLSQFYIDCVGLTPMWSNTAVCVRRDIPVLAMVELTRGQIQKLGDGERREQKYNRILINKVMKCGENSLVCDYGERLVLFTFHKSEDRCS